MSSLWWTLITIYDIIFNIHRTVFGFKIIALYTAATNQIVTINIYAQSARLGPLNQIVYECVFMRARSSNILLLSLSYDNTMLFISCAFPLRHWHLTAYLSRALQNIIISWYRTWPPKTRRWRRRRPRKHALKTSPLRTYRGIYEYSSLHLYTGYKVCERERFAIM